MKEVIDLLAHEAQNGTIFLAFMAAFSAATVVMYRKFLRPVAQRMEAVDTLARAQLTTNGGTSLLDKVNRIASNHEEAEAHWKSLETGHQTLVEGQEKLGAAIRVNTDVTERISTRQADVILRLTRVEAAVDVLAGGAE